MMPLSSSHQVTIEKSPCYISETEALRRIHAINTNIKLMVIVREPMARIQSGFAHFLNVSHAQIIFNITDMRIYRLNHPIHLTNIRDKAVVKWEH